MKLCDLHTHILPGVDDGAQTMDYALQMLSNAVASDVEMLAVTPHCGQLYGNYLDDKLKEQFKKLQQAAKGIPVQLVLGAEARVDEDLMQNLSAGKVPTINGSRYLLTEFAPNTAEEAFLPALQSILNLGYIPLVAHPERYVALWERPQMVMPWLDMGCHLQLTCDSILGEYGKAVQRTSAFLLQQDFVACVASDAHGLHRRSNFLMNVYDHLAVRHSRQYAQCMLYENPVAICHDADI